MALNVPNDRQESQKLIFTREDFITRVTSTHKTKIYHWNNNAIKKERLFCN